MTEPITIIVGDYTAHNVNSLLDACQRIRSECDGMLHSGIIHYVQGKLSEKYGFPVLKAAISQVLDKCPEIWPINIKDEMERNPELVLTDAQKNEYFSLCENLIVPIDGATIIDIIETAKEFLGEHGGTN